MNIFTFNKYLQKVLNTNETYTTTDHSNQVDNSPTQFFDSMTIPYVNSIVPYVPKLPRIEFYSILSLVPYLYPFIPTPSFWSYGSGGSRQRNFFLPIFIDSITQH